jgi:glucose/arabinose dehydrogenase
MPKLPTMILSGACSAWALVQVLMAAGPRGPRPEKGSEMRIGWRFGTGILSLLMAGIGGGWSPDEPGQSYAVSATKLPAPSPVDDPDKVAPEDLTWPPDTSPKVLKGFSISVFARLRQPNWMAVAPSGDVFVSQTNSRSILLLHDSDGKGRADQVSVFSSGYQAPHGLNLHGGYLYVSDPRTVYRVPYADGATSGGTAQKVAVAGGSPEDKAIARDIEFDSRGNFYWSFASRHADDLPPDATVQKVASDGSVTTFASGMSTVAGLAFYPGTDRLFAVVDERRGLGPGLVPDYLTHVEEGDFFGWPYAYIGHHPDPKASGQHSELVARSRTPDLLFEPGSTPLDFTFYDGRQFPSRYRGDAFVVLHGSWKQGVPVGYKIVHVPFRDGRPLGRYDNFITGWMSAGSDGQPLMLGRPACIAVAKDGSLLIADNVGGTIWRVSYTGR